MYGYGFRIYKVELISCGTDDIVFNLIQYWTFHAASCGRPLLSNEFVVEPWADDFSVQCLYESLCLSVYKCNFLCVICFFMQFLCVHSKTVVFCALFSVIHFVFASLLHTNIPSFTEHQTCLYHAFPGTHLAESSLHPSSPQPFSPDTPITSTRNTSSLSTLFCRVIQR